MKGLLSSTCEIRKEVEIDIKQRQALRLALSVFTGNHTVVHIRALAHRSFEQVIMHIWLLTRRLITEPLSTLHHHQHKTSGFARPKHPWTVDGAICLFRLKTIFSPITSTRRCFLNCSPQPPSQGILERWHVASGKIGSSLGLLQVWRLGVLGLQNQMRKEMEGTRSESSVLRVKRLPL